MLKPGEHVIAVVSHRDFVLIYGSYGTVLRSWLDVVTNMMHYRHEGELGSN